MAIDSIQDNTNVVSILEIQGIKCSARSFQIEMEMKQMMTVKPVSLFDDCLINNNRKTIVHQTNKTENKSEALEELSNQIENREDDIVIKTSDAETLEETDEVPLETEEATDIVLDENNENNNITLEENNEIIDENLENDENIASSEKMDLDDLEFNVDLEKLDNSESFTIKPHNDIYYERYREAQKRARIAKNLALQAYLEAKEIKNKYHLDDIDSDDDDFFNTEEQELESTA